MEYTTILGIDVSKQTFDTCDLKETYSKFDNGEEGFLSFVHQLSTTTLCVMEVTGIYHLELARFLYKRNIPVAVVNPLSVKRFIQMHLKRNKTDKADAKMIALYGQTQSVELWEPSDQLLEKGADYYAVMEQCTQIRSSLKNVLEALRTKKSDECLLGYIKEQIDFQSIQIEKMEALTIELIKAYNESLYTNIKSIKGIGKKTALALIITTNGFENFGSAKQLSSYFGIAPTEKSSGTSVNGKRKISKMGNPLVRKKLYMCSLQAAKHNTTCKQLYERLVNKGKPKKLALIAVANKLIKIAFAVAKAQIPYDENYRSIKPCT